MRQIISISLVIVLGAAILLALGFWQLQRLEWKHSVLLALEKEYKKDANTEPLSLEDFKKTQGYQRGYVEGTYLHDHEILLGPRILEGKLGYHLVTPFKLEDQSGVVLVNRGWVPTAGEMFSGVSVLRPQEKVRVSGMLRLPQGPNFFTPENDIQNKKWYGLASADDFFCAYNINGAGPLLLYAEGGEDGHYPVAEQSRLLLSNNHLQYAIFWFSMALIWMVIWCARLIFTR